MAHSKALKLPLCRGISSASTCLLNRQQQLASYARHLWTNTRSCPGLSRVIVPGSNLFVLEAPPSISQSHTTCLWMHDGCISRFSTFSKDREGRPLEISSDDTCTRATNSRFLALGFGALTATIGGYFLYHSNERRSPIKARKPEPTKVNTVPQKAVIGGPFKLINHKGEVVTHQDLVGNWTLLYFGYTSCPDNCPEELQKLAEAVEKIEKQTNHKIVPVFVTIDPQRDSPAQIKAYVSEFHPKFIGLTGSVDDIRQVAREYRVYYKKVEEEGSDYLVDHSNSIYMLDPNMEFVKFFGREYDADSLAAEVIEEIEKRKDSGFKKGLERQSD